LFSRSIDSNPRRGFDSSAARDRRAQRRPSRPEISEPSIFCTQSGAVLFSRSKDSNQRIGFDSSAARDRRAKRRPSRPQLSAPSVSARRVGLFCFQGRERVEPEKRVRLERSERPPSEAKAIPTGDFSARDFPFLRRPCVPSLDIFLRARRSQARHH
jgi:hypothetical protein